ncbi:MAG: FG-GAP repeat protein [Planctomycetales bacterium]|nr:FG-GAP repeat protein [Planctomycetales bacterium]
MPRWFALFTTGLLFVFHSFCFGASPEPKFRSQTLDAKLEIGYGLAIGDVDGDKKPDILLADKRQFVWYENGDWTRHVMVDGLTERDNVCLAARDLDGDGKVEVAVGAQWNPGETTDVGKSGSVHYLLRPENPRDRWTPIRLPHEPTVHRMHWVKPLYRGVQLVVLPLHGRGNRNGEGVGVRVLAYEMPEDPTQEWKTTLLDDNMHLTHNFDVITHGSGRNAWDSLAVAGKEGVRLVGVPKDDAPQTLAIGLTGTRGAGEVRFGRLGAAGAWPTMYVTIEPMHGNEVVACIAQGS